MRLGSQIPQTQTPDEWVNMLKQYGLSAAYCPVPGDADDKTVAAYREAAQKNNIVIAETGAWSNPLSADPATAKAAIELNKRQLDLAERIGAVCCVNIAGSRGDKWDGPDAQNLTRETFDMIVEIVRDIIDAVKPKRAFYTLETMPWAYPTGTDDYAELMKAIDRDMFAVHLDPVNTVNSVDRYFNTGALLRECFRKLGGRIVSCHAKDIKLRSDLTVHLEEVPPGMGGFDHATYLTELNKLAPDVPLMVEHLKNQQEYDDAVAFYKGQAAALGLSFL